MLMASKGRSAEGWEHGSRLRALTRFFDSGADTHTLVPLFPYDCPLAWRFGEKKAGGGSINSAIAAQPSPAQHLFIYTYPFPRQRCFWSCPVLSSSVPPVGRGVSPLCSPPPILLVIYPSYCPVTYE